MLNIRCKGAHDYVELYSYSRSVDFLALDFHIHSTAQIKDETNMILKVELNETGRVEA